MSMVTSCPSCATTFRVSQEQLKARQGRVRCGKCSDVFDAFKTLASLPDEPLPEPPQALSAEHYAATPVVPTPVQATLDIAPRPGDPVTGMRATSMALRLGLVGIDRSKLAFAASAVLLVAFVLQLGFALRASLTESFPGVRPWFERFCALSGCTFALPKRTQALAIESSDLQADSTRAGVIVLTATLRNRGSGPVKHPALELTLTNAQDQAVARRILLPADYLARAADQNAGMGARAEINVRVELDTGELKPAGYRLFLFYP